MQLVEPTGAYCPAPHWMQSVPSVALNVPLGQSVHSSLLILPVSSTYFPAAQLVQLTAPSAANCPALQASQGPRPSTAGIVPASQSAQAVLGSKSWSDVAPVQTAQVAALMPAYRPAVQMTQDVCPSSAAVPALQSVQAVLGLRSASTLPATQFSQGV